MPGLQVLIVGGSIGGLATALALRSQGHHIKIYEQAAIPDNTGAGVTIYPNALSALEALGADLAKVRATRVQQLTRVLLNVDSDTPDGTIDMDAKNWPWHNATYRDIIASLWEALHDSRCPGPEVEFHSSKSVYRIDPAKGIVYFFDGSEAYGDVIIGADGVHSICRSYVFSGRTERFRLKRHVFRAIIPRESIMKDPRTVKFANDTGHVHSYHQPDRSLLISPASDGQAVCIKLLYDDSMTIKNLSKDWRDPSSKRKLMRLATGFPEECIAVLEQCRDRDLVDQPIWDMDPLATFQSHRLALVGDAAHPMPPYCGQRIAMALEDALALGVVLELGIPASEVEDRLKLYSRTRKVRAGAVQQTMRVLEEISICDVLNDLDSKCGSVTFAMGEYHN
ncbi:hypothetical protein A1O1_07869 [Capronia coronata CBS 617.96]|uniref:FAD-binding domain-containing protein n=1 Tax=Capronia coronata CBS 617.96 TaxID=1182541 RepID=W9YHP5_9EURO|nr:uncharacterized protein A1O1_07869 [Capronia coronata CBS 617.96]EXJ81804.1 hypothetical protein A1O1_07869 [Capronia coronata CBS 617.96]